jgi:hypothetical protein
MRSHIVLAACLLLLPATLHAQRVELFGGYSYLRLDSAGGVNLNGWNAALNLKAKAWLGLAADFSGHYGSPFGPSTSQHTFLVGPQLSFPARVSPFVHALVGGVRTSTAGVTDTSFAAALGGGIDSRVAPFLAYRLFQVDYLLTRFGGTTQNDVRVSSGLVIRF